MAVPTDSELLELSKRFVCVRIIQMGGVDLATFQFDPFLSWSLFMMNADKTIYGRYGNAHPATKLNRKDSNPNHTIAGLKAALTRALEIHGHYAEDPKALRKALAGKTGPEPRWRFVEKTPQARKYKRMKRSEGGKDGCVHCHEVQRATIDSYLMKGIELPDSMLWLYPRPAVLGLTLDTDHCARVAAVRPKSWADAAGVRVGDDILTLGGQPLCSTADVQWVLQNRPDAGGALPVEVRRGKETLALEIELPKGWRLDEDWGWRYRVAGYASWLWTGVGYEDGPHGIVVDHRSPPWFKKTNRDGRRALQPGDVITEVDGRKGMDRSDLLAYLMREKKLGSKVRVKVTRGGKQTDVSFKIPKERPEVLGH